MPWTCTSKIAVSAVMYLGNTYLTHNCYYLYCYYY